MDFGYIFLYYFLGVIWSWHTMIVFFYRFQEGHLCQLLTAAINSLTFPLQILFNHCVFVVKEEKVTDVSIIRSYNLILEPLYVRVAPLNDEENDA